MPYQYAVIGLPVNHSLSPFIHQAFARECGVELSYGKIEGDEILFEQQVVEFFANGGSGLNITLPFKERAYALAKVHTRRCDAAKAANTLWIEGGVIMADNTDGAGLVADLQRYTSVTEQAVLILGAGGAARGIIPPLLDCQPRLLQVANRSLARAKALQKEFTQITYSGLSALDGAFDIIINATSMGFNTGRISLPSAIFKKNTFCYDLTYKQQGVTPFVEQARALGCLAVDGLGMLVEQAARSFEVWHGQKPEVHPVLKKLRTNSI